MNPPTITLSSGHIKNIVLQAGFDQAGIAPAEALPKDAGFWKSWIAAGRHGTMRYLENPKRESVKEWYPQAGSVLLAALYYQGPNRQIQDAEQPTEDPRPPLGRALPKGEGRVGVPVLGRIASYALYGDYHDVVNKRMKTALGVIRKLNPTIEGRIFADTSPVLERSYGRQAGLGWIGKNTMLINKDRGSYFFIGGMALNIRLEPEPDVEADHCGTCRRCIEACPTQCLKPYELDATKCISYLTIEHKENAIPDELSSRMGPWVFGCDICQQVCPFNQRTEHSPPPPVGEGGVGGSAPGGPWQPKIRTSINLDEALGWSENDYRDYFRGLPVRRASWNMFRRNARTALRNTGSK